MTELTPIFDGVVSDLGIIPEQNVRPSWDFDEANERISNNELFQQLVKESQKEIKDQSRPKEVKRGRRG